MWVRWKPLGENENAESLVPENEMPGIPNIVPWKHVSVQISRLAMLHPL